MLCKMDHSLNLLLFKSIGSTLFWKPEECDIITEGKARGDYVTFLEQCRTSDLCGVDTGYESCGYPGKNTVSHLP